MCAGFDLLPEDLQIYMILGNHDLETQTKKNALFLNDNTLEKDCAIIRIEKECIQNKQNIHYDLFHSVYQQNTLIMMIDTSMYTEDVDKFVPCYNTFLQENFISSKQVVAHQNEIIMSEINKIEDGIENMIIIGHQPISCIKYDKGDTKYELLNDIPAFIDTLTQIYSKFGNSVTYYYLCADLHMYQEGKVTITMPDGNEMVIHQYIVGNGGTGLDDSIPQPLPPLVSSLPNVDYIMDRFERKCGFLECTIHETGPVTFNPIFVPDVGVGEVGGGKRRKIMRSKKIKSKTSTRTKRNHRKNSKKRTTRRQKRLTKRRFTPFLISNAHFNRSL